MKRPILTTILLSLFLCSQTQAGDKVLHLNMEEASGNLTDLSGHGNNCTAAGGPIYQVSSAEINRGKAIQLDTNDYFNCGNGSSLDNNDYSFLLWLKSSNPTLYSIAVRMRVDANNELIIQYPYTDGKLRVYTKINAVQYTISSSLINVIVTTDWHFIGITMVGTTWTVYYDGVQKYSGTQGDMANLVGAPTFYIGNNTTSSCLNGLVDDIKIYNYALSDILIRHEYQQSRLVISRKYNPWKWTDLFNLAFIMKGDQLYEKDNRISYLRKHPVN